MNRLLTVTLVALTAGCVQFVDRPLDPRRTVEGFDRRSLDAAALKQYLREQHLAQTDATPVAAWNLNALTAAGIYFHPEFDLAKCRAQVAVADARAASERPNPTLGLGPGYNTSSSDISPWILGLGINLPIETAGKRRFRTDEARCHAQAAGYAVADAAWQLRRHIRAALVSLAENRDAATALEAAATTRTELVAIMEHQQTVGEISAFDLSAARQARDEARLHAKAAQAAADVARAQLAAAIGIPAHALDGTAFDTDDLLSPLDEQALTDARLAAVTGRADLLGALAEYAAAQSALRVAIAGQYPDLELGPGYEFDQGDSKWSLGLSLTLPVVSRNRGAIAHAIAYREEAAAAVLALQARILGDVDEAAAACRAARDQMAAVQSLLDEATARTATLQGMRTAGELSKTDVLAGHAETAGLRVELTRARWAYAAARGQLEDALQRPADLPATRWRGERRDGAPNAEKNEGLP